MHLCGELSDTDATRSRYQDRNTITSDNQGVPSYPKAQNPSNIRTNIQPSTGWVSQPFASDTAGSRQLSDAYLASQLSSSGGYTPISSTEELPWEYLHVGQPMEPLDQEMRTTANPNSNGGNYENVDFTYPITVSQPSWNMNWIPRAPSQDPVFPVPYLSLSNLENAISDTTDYPSYDMDTTSQHPPSSMSSGTSGMMRQPRWSSTRRNSDVVKVERRSTRTKPTPEKEQHRPPNRKSLSSASSASTRQLFSIKSTRKSSTAEDVDFSVSESSQTTRSNHNLVEKKYRNRLNYQFEELLSTLPKDMAGNEYLGFDGDGEKKVSKAEVLILAKRRIQDLERTSRNLEGDREELLENVDQLKMDWMMRGGQMLP